MNSRLFSQEQGLISIGELLKKANDISLNNPVITDNKNIQRFNIPAGFDIETTNFYDNGEKRAIMYHWQFGIYNVVTSGRTWEEFIAFINILSKVMNLSLKRRLVVYVHNLPYEFQFIRKRFKWHKVFILKDRQPVYAIMENGVEFRCSLKLSGGKSLKNIGDDLIKYPVSKMVGDLDYSICRTPLTPLTEKELKYCENDIRVILSYIQEKIEQDGDITRIPLTNTGYVREYCRKACYSKWKPYRQIIETLTIEPEEYSQLKRAFMGGFTHANAHHVQKNLHNVSSHDILSSYPAVMVLEKFPMSKGIKINANISKDELQRLIMNKACLFDIELFDVMPIRYNEHPISRYKCRVCENCVVDNGRIVMAERLVTTITETDFIVFSMFYTWSKINIYNMWIYEKNYLPRQFVLSVLEQYGRKTTLKDRPEEVINYNISKGMINSTYGMMVTDPVRDNIEYTDDQYVISEANIFDAIEKYNKSKRRFLFYPWGVWVTSYARRNLFSSIIKLGDDYVYSDTDSSKCLNPAKHTEFFENYNEQILTKIKKASEYHHIDPELFSPKTKGGKVKTIGLWDDEGVYETFKTLGAKRYMTFRHESKTIKEDDGTIIKLTEPVYQITLAGSNKVKTMSWLRLHGNPFDDFKDGMTVPASHSGRLISTYIDEDTEGDVIDVNGTTFHYHELSSVHMEPSDYTMSMAEEFVRYLEGVVDIGQ